MVKTADLVGSTLKNGALVLQHTVRDDKEIVLCSWKDGHEFVTWRLDNEGNAFWGHYFSWGCGVCGGKVTDTKEDAFERAVKDFLTR